MLLADKPVRRSPNNRCILCVAPRGVAATPGCGRTFLSGWAVGVGRHRAAASPHAVVCLPDPLSD